MVSQKRAIASTRGKVGLRGFHRLEDIEESDYAPIVQLLDEVANAEPSHITLNLKQLEFLNSSGINMLSKFVISVRKKKMIQLLVVGSNDVPWQQKSLKNLEKLLPTLKLRLE